MAKKEEKKLKRWNVGGAVTASTFVGTVEARTWEEAIEKASRRAGVSVCHECSKEISDPEISSFWAEDEETGRCFSEPTDQDKIEELQGEVDRLREALLQIYVGDWGGGDVSTFAGKVLDDGEKEQG